MKIKKVFSIASVCSLAILMTACSNKNSSIMNKDILESDTITLDEYQKEIATKKNVESVFKDKTIYKHSDSIVIVNDANYYYAYNLSLDEKEIFKIAYNEVISIEIDFDEKAIVVAYANTSEIKYGYEVYSYDGKCIFEKASSEYMNTSYQSSETIYTGVFTKEKISKYQIYSYAYIDGSQVTKTINYYYVEEENSLKNEKTPIRFLSEEEYYEEYGKTKRYVFDGKEYGLKGYQIERIGEREYYIYKKDKLINHLVLSSNVSLSVVNDGYILFQTTEVVTKDDKYDIFYDGKYLVVNTYKINMLTSKVTKIKDFHYYIISSSNNPMYVEDKFIGGICKVIDYKTKKNAIYEDNRTALVKSNGKIKFQEAMSAKHDLAIQIEKEYYYYDLGNNDSNFSNEKTVVYGKNGEIKKTYEGIYYENVLIKGDESRLIFINDDNKGLASLTSYTRINLGKYTGTDINGKKVLVEVDNGSVNITDITGYTIYNNTFLTKTNETLTTAYSFDSSLTNLGFEYTSISDLGNDCFRLYNSTGSSVVQVK